MEPRPARRDDVPSIRRIAGETWYAAYDEVIGPGAVERQVEQRYDRESVESSVTGDSGHYLVVEREGDLMGYVTGGPSEDGPTDAVLAALYVLPDRWGEGAGGALLERFLDGLAEDDHDDCWPAVLADNDRAVGFYERHGFAVDERRSTTVGGVETVELVMTRSLP